MIHCLKAWQCAIMSEDGHPPRELEYSINFGECRKLRPSEPKITAVEELASTDIKDDPFDFQKGKVEEEEEEGYEEVYEEGYEEEEEEGEKEREIMIGSSKFDRVCSCRRVRGSRYKFRMFNASKEKCVSSFDLPVEHVSSLVICGDNEPLVFIGTGDAIRQVNLEEKRIGGGYKVRVPGGVQEMQASPVSRCIYGRSEDRLFVWYYAEQESRCIASGVSTFYVDRTGVWLVSDDRLFKYSDKTREVREIGGLCPGTTIIRSMSYCWLLSAGYSDSDGKLSVCWWHYRIRDSSGIRCGYLSIDDIDREVEIVADRELGFACVLCEESYAHLLMMREDKGVVNMVRVYMKNDTLDGLWQDQWSRGGQVAMVVLPPKEEDEEDNTLFVAQKRWTKTRGMYFGTNRRGQWSCMFIENQCSLEDRWVDTSLLSVQSRSKNINVVFDISRTWLMRINNLLNYSINADCHRIIDVTFSADEDVMYVLAEGMTPSGSSHGVAVMAFGCYPPRHLTTYFPNPAVFRDIHPKRVIVSDLLGTITIQENEGSEIVFKKPEIFTPARQFAADTPPTLDEIRTRMAVLRERFKQQEERGMKPDDSSALGERMEKLAHRLTHLIDLADKIGFKSRPEVLSCPKDAALGTRAKALLNKLEHAMLGKARTPNYTVKRLSDQEVQNWCANTISTKNALLK